MTPLKTLDNGNEGLSAVLVKTYLQGGRSCLLLYADDAHVHAPADGTGSEGNRYFLAARWCRGFRDDIFFKGWG